MDDIFFRVKNEMESWAPCYQPVDMFQCRKGMYMCGCEGQKWRLSYLRYAPLSELLSEGEVGTRTINRY